MIVMPIHLLIICLLLCGTAFKTSAKAISATDTMRDYLIHVWQTDKGLPHNWISSIVQTPDGYLWVGTRYGGLARFDGVRFVHFNQLDTPELKDVQVEHLSVDETGRLWIFMGNESVSAFFNGQFNLFRPPRSEPHVRPDRVLTTSSNLVLFAGEFPGLSLISLDLSHSNQWASMDPQRILPDSRTFCVDKKYEIFFLTQGHRLGTFSNTNFSFVKNNPYDRNCVAMALDPSKNLWIASPQHIAQRDGIAFLDRTPTNGPPPENILHLAFSGDGGLWVLERNRIRKMVNGQWTVEINSSELLKNFSPETVSLHGDAQGNAWLIVSGLGMWHYKSDGSAHLLTEQTGLPSRFITCWFQDAEGDVWIGMHGGGMACIRERLFHPFGPADGLPDKVVSSTCVDNFGNLWAGTMSGDLAKWEDGKFQKIKLPWPEGDANPSVTVFPVENGDLWIGTLNHGLARYHNEELTQPPKPWDTVRVLFNDSQHRLWVGGLVNIFCLTNGGYKTYGSAEGFVDSHAVGDITEDAEGAIWIGTGPGELWKFSGGKFTRFTPPAEWPAVRFSDLLPDTNGVIWIGTLGGGLLRFQDGKFARILKSHGLPDNNVSQLLDSRDGFVWGGTYAGIFRASKKDLTAVANGAEPKLACRVYGEFDGLPALECSSGFQPSCWRSDDGLLWFATANGVASVDPSKTVPNKIPPTVIIEEMLVDGKPLKVQPHIGVPLENVRSQPLLNIPAGRHYVQFRFTGLSFTAPDGVRFRAKLDGGDGPWQEIGTVREIGYGPLSPGIYRFRVIACNNNGVWNENGDTLAFTVEFYFWETRWFKFSLGFLTLVLIAATAAVIQRRRYRRRLERVERQREVELERARIARDLHDELGTSLTQISLLSALANRESTPPGEAKELIQEVRGRAKEMVIALDEIVWAVNPKNDTVAGLVSYLSHFAEEFFRASNLLLRLDLPPQLPNTPISAEMRHHLFLAFKEALNNAARHSTATQINLSAKVYADKLVIQVNDNGGGFTVPNKERGRSGQGLTNMQRRLEQIGGRTTIETAPGLGTTVTFQLPLVIVGIG